MLNTCSVNIVLASKLFRERLKKPDSVEQLQVLLKLLLNAVPISVCYITNLRSLGRERILLELNSSFLQRTFEPRCHPKFLFGVDLPKAVNDI